MVNQFQETPSEKTVQPLQGKIELYDDFTDDRAPGAVIGTLSTSGHGRQGVDVEGVLSIDNGALRIAPLIEAGFNRAVLTYGPFSKRPGLAFAVYMLNGHNTAQAEPLPDTFRARLDQWLKGSEIDSRRERVLRWLLSGRVRRAWRQFRRWKRTAKGERPVPLLDENLAVGWFPAEVSPDPRMEGNAFIMHALGPENGELWAGEVTSRTRSLRGVQNVPLYFVAVVRAEGTIYYVSSLEGAVGLTPYPWMRPIAVDSGPLANELYVGIHQSVLGQIGWRLDTRVQGIRVADMAGYESWCGGAHAADKLDQGARAGAIAELGGEWEIRSDATDATQPAATTMAVLDPGAPSGLIHAVAICGDGSSRKVGLVWRCLDEHNHWRLELARSACEIVFITDGDRQIMASREYKDSNDRERRLQVLDDGSRLLAYVDGEPLSDTWIMDARLNAATRVGVLFDESVDGGKAISAFEAHPRQVRLPDMFDMGKPWFRQGTREVVVDDFSGEPADLEGRKTPVGGKCWNRIIGNGFIEVTGQGFARVRGTAQEPCPRRTAYCVDWPHPDFVDIEVTITPPGNQAGERQRTTSGFILYQDSNNYMILNAYRADSYSGGSVSTFFKFQGFEDIYDAIWSNVGNRVYYGRPLRLRLCCDSERYLVFINEEVVLYRAFRDVYLDFSRLHIRKVGLVANWEFGTDTGTKFEQCRIRV